MDSIPVWIAPEIDVIDPDERPGETGPVFRCRSTENAVTSLLAALAVVPGASFGIVWGPGPTRLTACAWQRLRSVQEDSNAGMVYGNYATPAGETELLPMRPGSLRDEFDTGPVWLVEKNQLSAALTDLPTNLTSLESVRYGLRLGLMRRASSVWIGEPVCSTMYAKRQDLFAYTRREVREQQKELEAVLTDHLSKIKALLPPRKERYVDTRRYALKASVVIPVRNRERTIRHAVRSALMQEANFPFNVLVVDNHSRDKTRREILEGANGDKRVEIKTPARKDLGIGGCWNFAAGCSDAGKYLVQLDSDDVYATSASLQTLVDLIDEGPWAMAVGSYKTVDMDANEVPPGDVTHEEWTDQNGHNNLLRVSGVGAPRVLATGFLREYPMPNVSYGEDYAAALRVSRTYHIARHFGITYYARRWEGNSDFDVAPPVARSREGYKDQLRTIELQARTALLKASHDHLG